uniref:Secreted protein n=1 Tax=Ditylenchus dipsaci TaxID=166011 RepID=A0A915E7H1_9BILA
MITFWEASLYFDLQSILFSLIAWKMTKACGGNRRIAEREGSRKLCPIRSAHSKAVSRRTGAVRSFFGSAFGHCPPVSTPCLRQKNM